MVGLGYLYAPEQYRRAVAGGNAACTSLQSSRMAAGHARQSGLAAGPLPQALDQRYDFSYRQMQDGSRNRSASFFARRAAEKAARARLYAGTLDGVFGEKTIGAVDA